MKEIFAVDLDLAIKEICLEAKKTYCGERFQVWELKQEEFEKLCNIEEKDWKESWGMWRSADGSNMTNPIRRYNINNHYIKAWDGDDRLIMLEECNNNINHEDYCFELRKYDSLIDYILLEIGVSQPRNVCALAVDLASINGMKLSELFKKYQKD